MNKKDKKLQKHLVDEMMKVYETNPDVMIYMQSLMENYEKLEKENKQLKDKIDNVNKYIDDLLEKDIDKNILEAIKYMLGDKEWIKK